MAVQWSVVFTKVFAATKKYGKWLLTILFGGAVIDVVLDHYRDELMYEFLPSLGRIGQWLLTYPFAILAAALVFIALWMIYLALTEAFNQVESPLVGPKREKLYRARFDPRFLARFVAAVVVFTTICVYGIVRHYKNPFPAVVGVSNAWFAEKFRENDLYISISIKNYSDVPVTARVQRTLSVFDEAIPASEIDMPPSIFMPPWHENTLPVELRFKPGPPSVQWALDHNGVKIGLDTTYNDGKREVTYHWLGKLMGDHYVPGLPGHIYSLKSSLN